MKHVDIKQIIVRDNSSIKEAMRNIDVTGLGMALIVDDQEKLQGLVTDGDIRRSIINGVFIEKPVKEIMNISPVIINESSLNEELNKITNLQNNSLGKIPVVDPEGKVKDLIILSKNKLNKNLSFVSEGNLPRKQAIDKVLVIGGAGYIGSILVNKLLNKGYKVTVLDTLLYSEEPLKEAKKHPNFKLIVGDARHIEKIVEAVQNVDAVIHLSGIVGDPACQLSPQKTIEQNYLATQTIAEICKFHQINKFIFASSCSVYGTGDKILTEESELSPVSLYAKDKILSEQALLNIMDENFSPVILRFSTIYGLSPRPRFDLVLNILTAHAVRNGKFKIFGGEQYRPMVHVSDVAESCILAMEAPLEKVKGQVFNVGSNEQNYKIIELGEKVKEIIPEAEMVVEGDDVDKRNYNVCFDKIKNVLGFKPQFTVEEGVREIKEALISGAIGDFTDNRYNNYNFLKKGMAVSQERELPKIEVSKQNIPIHKNTYDALAKEYNQRWRGYIGHQEKVLTPFKNVLMEKFGSGAKVLDVGCGVGLDLYLLDKFGFTTYGFDLSPEMVKFARINVPNANVSVNNFLEDPIEKRFDGVVMNAFIHLFPKNEVSLVLDKLKNILLPEGCALISTTSHKESREGFIEKQDYKDQFKRFRKYWTRKELILTLQDNGFKIIDFCENHESGYNKHWMNAIVQKVDNEE